MASNSSSSSPSSSPSSSSGNASTSISYRDAGVDIDVGNALIDRIKPLAAATRRPGVMAGLGGFGGLFELDLQRHPQPVLVSGTDGVGTKLRLAIDHNQHHSVGIDLVGMCVNDIIVLGAEPLYFLDYYATGKLSTEVATAVIGGIAKGCEASGCALLGGETAEMPGMYEGDDYDLAGFAVGVVNKPDIIDGSAVHAGDCLIALASSGPHSNGYSLIRKVLDTHACDPQADLDGRPLIEALMAPTRLYVKSLLALIAKLPVHALAHITGGGLTENLPRVLPTGCDAHIDLTSWELPPVFQWLQTTGPINQQEMLRTFNCGVGMVVCVAEQDREAALEQLNTSGEQAWVIGSIETASDSTPCVRYTAE